MSILYNENTGCRVKLRIKIPEQWRLFDRGSFRIICKRQQVLAERNNKMSRYEIVIEIFEGKGGQLRKEGNKIIYPESIEKEGICAWMYRGDGQRSYQRGQKFLYPRDAEKICPWLLGSMNGIIQILQDGGTLPWKYRGTPYEKEINPDGVTTEFIRCIDPTASGVVVKLIRTKI